MLRLLCGLIPWGLSSKNYCLSTKSAYLLLCLLTLTSLPLLAQEPTIGNLGTRLQQRVGGSGRRSISGTAGTDSLRRRDKFEDSITIRFRYLDSTRNYMLDSSILDFTSRYPVPPTHIYLGNTGSATRSLLFSPKLEAGFDAGFHAFDVYKWKLEQVRFFQTTRPYSELNYFLGSRVEQIIEVMHTQNIKPTWNFAFQYRLINSPGYFQNQRTNHNNYLFTSKFQSRNLRYNNYFVLLGNKMLAAENGGIVDTTDILNDPIYKERFNINTWIGGSNPFSSNFFGSKINTGNKYNEFTFLLRQQYDLGRKDSIITDSTIIPLFYPRLRFEHTFQLDQNKYVFMDNVGDSVYYKTNYDTSLRRPTDTLLLVDRWNILSNDFSIYQFPDAKNLHQFIRIGLTVQNISGELSSGKKTFFNTIGHAEYRNRSKNQQWDIGASGKLFFTGFNSGDYEAHISLQRMLGKKLGYFQLGFENTSRTPSFLFDNRSSFYLMKNTLNLKKENNTHLSAMYFLPSFRFRLSGHYYLVNNYTYYRSFYQVQQEGSLFNLLQIALQKTIRLGKRWNWHADIWFQQKVGNAPVNVPVFYTRNRIGYEGNLGFRNLDIAIGTEIRYRPAYKADHYSPVLGQFFYQDSITIRNPLPDISAYLHFRIRPFKAFIRVENLNTAKKLRDGGFGFINNNLVAPGYPLPGLQFRMGIYWSFVN
ncbi:MAG: putative porin [Chitinophagaceae bacterium]